MCGFPKTGFWVTVVLLALTAVPAMAGQMVSSSSQNVRAVHEAGGLHIRAAGSAGQFGGDLAPVQTFEIVRPNNQPITIGRLFTSCTCVRLESPKQTYQAGEPAILHLRNIHPTPAGGMNYAIYVQITSPVRTTLRYDTFVQSSQFIPAAAGEAPTRGNIVADGVLNAVQAYEGDIELIVPTADIGRDEADADALSAKTTKPDLDNAERVVQAAVAGARPAAAKEAVPAVADATWKQPVEKAAAPRETSDDPASRPELAARSTSPDQVRTAPPATGSDPLWAELKPRLRIRDTAFSDESPTAVAVPSSIASSNAHADVRIQEPRLAVPEPLGGLNEPARSAE